MVEISCTAVKLDTNPGIVYDSDNRDQRNRTKKPGGDNGPVGRAIFVDPRDIEGSPVDAIADLKLEVGKEAYAIVKSTEVIVGVPD